MKTGNENKRVIVEVLAFMVIVVLAALAFYACADKILVLIVELSGKVKL